MEQLQAAEIVAGINAAIQAHEDTVKDVLDHVNVHVWDELAQHYKALGESVAVVYEAATINLPGE